MNRLFFLLFTCVFLFNNTCKSQSNHPKKELTVAFYNVENLFDTINNHGVNDGEFTPKGINHWTSKRYGKKLNDISKVLSSVNKNELPEIIGLCEIENRIVLNDLVKTGSLKKGNYKIIHFESPDYRGIDCAMIYRPDEFKVTESIPVAVSFPDDPDHSTRDILYIKGETQNREVFHIFVNHWPSRNGGLQQTEKKRIVVAQILKTKTDAILRQNPKANIIIMGDLNDEPTNKSLNEILKAKKPTDSNGILVNLMYPLFLQHQGSYNYRGSWDMLDNIIVSKSLIDNNGYTCIEKQGFVFSEKWMKTNGENGKLIPNRTYAGKNYTGGVSDHFPVYIRLTDVGR